MKKNFLRILLPILIIATLIAAVTVVAIAANDENGETKTDAMVAIRADEELEAKLLFTTSLEDDGYLGIPVDITFYHDASFAVNPDYNGTSLIMYVVNTYATRTGTDSDVDIIKSMLERGYIVAVTDYHNSKKTTTPDLDWAAQTLNNSLRAGKLFPKDSSYNAQIFRESFVVPAGHNVERDRVFWEYDKHSADGTLEKIVDIWNYDFRGYKGDRFIIPWYNEDGRKETQPGIHDGSEPVWYSIKEGTEKVAGEVTVRGTTYVPDPENGLYVYVKHTKANVITDCVKPDGSPIDLNLYTHIIYPTNPTEAVPVMTLASSSQHLASACVNGERPHVNGFGFDGYGVVMYDFAYVPMSRDDHYGYFDGSSPDSGSVTGDNFTYNLFTYNSQLVPTAAMRYIRYIAQAESETFKFTGAIGVVGNSKGSMITHLADKELGYLKTTADGYTEAELIKYADEYIVSFGSYYYVDGYSGATRFEAGKTTYTKDGATIDGGERQPWLVLNGTMIASDAQFVYSSCGGMNYNIDENFGPYMTTGHIGIETSGYGGNNQLINRAKELDLPFLGFELVLGHTLLQRESAELGIDPYIGYKNFVHYFLNDAAPTAIYATPVPGGEISVTAAFTVKFSGIVDASEVAKATVTDKDGNVVLGIWESGFGKTEWTFKPTLPLAGGEKYTLTVPTTVKAENGKEIAEEFTATYYTEPADTTTVTTDKATVTDTQSTSFTVTVPAFGEKYNRAYAYFFVSNKAANTIRLYKNDASSESNLVGEVAIDGTGSYAVELTSLFASMTPGETVTLVAKAGKTTAVCSVSGAKLTFEDFEDGEHCLSFSKQTNNALIDIGGEHGMVASISMKPNTTYTKNVAHHIFYNQASAFSISSMLPTLKEMDLGRQFVVTFDVYDETSRMFSISTGHVSSSATGVIDYDADYKNYTTKAGEWITVSYAFDIQDILYGKTGYRNIGLSMVLQPTGESELPIYIDNLRLEEITTDVEIDAISLSMTTAGGDAYKAPIDAAKPYLVNGTAYASLADAVAALGTTDGTVTLQSNVIFSKNNFLTGIKAQRFTLDLNGYSIRSNAWSTSVIAVNSSSVKYITVKNGSIYLDGGSLVGFENSAVSTKVTLTMQNVYIGTELGATTTSLLVNTSASAPSQLSLILDECTIDMRERRFTKNPVKMLTSSSSKVTILGTTLRGGEIYLSRTDKTMIVEKMSSLFFEKNDGGYTRFMLDAGRSFSNDVSIITSEGFAILGESAADVPLGYRVYEAKISKESSTPYGIIPDAYTNVEKYPLVLFNRETYEFLGASDLLIHDSNNSAILNKISNKTEGKYAIVLRRDFTHNNTSYNFSFLGSEFVIDLGGYTLTYNYGITPQAKSAGHNVRATIKNGTLLANTNAAFFNTQALTQTMSFSFTFEGVTFKIASGMAPAYLVTRTSSSWTEGKAKPFSIDVTVKDCTFDMTGFTGKTTLFCIGHANGQITENVTLIGGNIIGDANTVSLYTLAGTQNCSFAIDKGADGNYITNTRETGSATPDLVVNTPDGVMIFTKAIAEKDGMTTYALDMDPLVTPYGRIPKEYADAPETYKMLLFNIKTGEVIWAGSQWGGEGGEGKGGILEAIKNNCSKGSLAIYFQADVTTTMTYNNHGNTTGTHIIDLNGHTLTAGHTVFNAQAKNKNKTSTAHFTVKNGTINLGKQQLLSIGSNTYDGDYRMTATYLFENVNITNISNGSYVIRDNLCGNFTTTTNVIFRECSLEFNSGRSAAFFYLGYTNTDNGTTSASFTVDITLEGGSIVTNDAKIPTFLQVANGMTNKTLHFVRGKNGFTTVTTKKTSTYSDNKVYPTNLGDRYLILDHYSEDNTQSIYTFGKKTEYGIIPEGFQDTVKYPIVVFNKDKGTLVAGFSLWSDETKNSALGYIRQTSGNFVVLLQCDHTTASSTDYNFSSKGGEVVVDLNGYTLTVSGALYHAQAKSSSELSVLTKNGTIVFSSTTVLLGISSTFRADPTKTMVYTFENVTFRMGGSKCRLVADTGTGGKIDATVIFNGCTFITPTTLENAIFDLGNMESTYPIHIQVNGGEFQINTSGALPIYRNVNGYANHTIAFGAYNGAYPIITAPARLYLGMQTFPTENGVLGLRKISEANNKISYTMAPLSFVSAYLNLGSDLNLIYRAYLPVGYENPFVTFTFDGVTTVVTAYTVDNNGLYLFRLPHINPAQMGKTVTAVLSATLNGETVTVTHDTLSVKSYLEQLKADHKENAALTDLVDKLLVYGAAAQQYVGQSADEFVGEIGTPDAIPESENILSFTGESSDIVAFTKLGMRLDGAFALRIVLSVRNTNGLTLVATQNGEEREMDLSSYENNNGEIVVIYDNITAGELGDTITFTVKKNGESIGKTLTVSPNAYLYRLAATNNNADLVTLAKATYAYGIAAKAYAAE